MNRACREIVVRCVFVALGIAVGMQRAGAQAAESLTGTPSLEDLQKQLDEKAAISKRDPAARSSIAVPGSPPATSDDLRTRGSYSIGLSVGQTLHASGAVSGSVSIERIAEGIRDALGGVPLDKGREAEVNALLKSVRDTMGESNHAAARAFLAENARRPGVITTASGLQYRVLVAGDGAAPRASDQVTVNYRGTLLDGVEFDSSYKRGTPATFAANAVIKGWQEALSLMSPGAKWELFIPPELGYDLQSPAAIPPGSLLKFEVELLSVKSGGSK
jgi:FKBP-type peptidyl-prolyl cis-trans isomerase FklB